MSFVDCEYKSSIVNSFVIRNIHAVENYRMVACNLAKIVGNYALFTARYDGFRAECRIQKNKKQRYD